jgi:hypothetical protein
MRRRPSAYRTRTSGPSTDTGTSRRPRRPTSSKWATPKKRGAFGAGLPNASEKCSAFVRGVPQARGAPIPPLPPPSIPWPWRCWWPRCRSSPPGDFLPLPIASHIVATLGMIAAQRLSGAAGQPSLLVTQPAATVKGGSKARSQRTPDASPQALQPAPPRPLAPLPVPSHLNP